jgi:hypothetical protein
MECPRLTVASVTAAEQLKVNRYPIVDGVILAS